MLISKADAALRKPMARNKGELMTVAKATTRYEHGTKARYTLGKCRCKPCTETNRLSVEAVTLARIPWIARKGKDDVWRVLHRRTLRIARTCVDRNAARMLVDQMNAEHRRHHPDPTQLVPVQPILDHIHTLQGHGVGLKRVAKASGVAYSSLCRMLEKDIVRTRNSTIQKVLAVTPDIVAEGMRMRGDEAFVLLERLVAAGYARAWISQQLGSESRGLHIGIATPMVKIKTARNIHALYCKLQESDQRLVPIPTVFRVGVIETVAERNGRRTRTTTIIGTVDPRNYPHGMRARYTEAGCRCKSCVKANRDYEDALLSKQQLRYRLRHFTAGEDYTVVDATTAKRVFSHRLRARAIAVRDAMNSADPKREGRVLVSAQPAIAHIHALLAAGATITDIARAVGVNTNLIGRFRDRAKNLRKTSRDVARRILAIDESIASGNPLVPAAPIYAMLDRLSAAGFDPRWVAESAGIYYDTLRTNTMRAERARAIMAMYSILRERVSLVRDLERQQGEHP